ncbi:hypothetical protein [Hymenobacter algoricola]|uniref:Outer membrane protein beta-barrel domain-containing protein n=1 Tax=Hymenobacter algoricola TaxID=486267 RepID=A0ABP7NF24_9BACT
MDKKILLSLICALWVYNSAAQQRKLKLGISAGLVRSFVYPQNFSTKGRDDYVHAEGQIGYMLSLHVEKPLTSRIAYNFGARFLSTPTYYDVALLVPNAFLVTHTWRAERRNYRFYNGLSYTILERGNRKLRTFGGLLAGVETQRIQIDHTKFSFYETYANNLAVNFDYTSSMEPIWLMGTELGLGVRLFNGVDLSLLYNYNFTHTPKINYTSTISYEGPPGSPRTSTGTLTGRPNFAAAELVIWFN